MNKAPLPELLAPCGFPEALDAALQAGADAVYLGGTVHNARMHAKNFDLPALSAAVSRCHHGGVKLYVTMNTLVFDREKKEALRYADALAGIGVDALIVADLGLARSIHACLPSLPLHASTQCSGHNTDAAVFLASLGFSRMVCARELSREAIADLVRHSPIPIEMFVHGAHCVCHSGQCLMSAMIGGRSGNRGACAQPCRMAYNRADSFPLSLRDLCLAEHITDILALGVASLKVEGRMKSPDYVYGVISIYRRLLQERRNASPEEMRLLAALFSRGGFTDGYFTSQIGPAMLGIRSESDKKASAALPASLRAPTPRPVSSHVSRETYLPGEEALHALLQNLPSEHPAAPIPGSSGPTPKKPQRTARFLRASQIPSEAFDFFDLCYLPAQAFLKKVPPQVRGVIFPAVMTDAERPAVEAQLRAARQAGVTHCLVGNVGHFAMAASFGFTLHADFRLNLTNSDACDAIAQQVPIEDFLLSPELTLPQLRDLPVRGCAIVYGRLPLMLLEKPVGIASLRDRSGALFPIIPGGDTAGAKRDLLLNCLPIWTADQAKQLTAAGIRRMHFLFTTESADQIRKVIEATRSGSKASGEVRRIGIREPKEPSNSSSTPPQRKERTP